MNIRDNRLSRRVILQGVGSVALVGFGNLPFAPAVAAANDKYPDEAFKQKSEADAIKSLYGKTAEASDKIKLDAPEIAENGAVVPVSVTTTLADVTSISFLVSENPVVLIASYKIPAGTMPAVANRIKMAKTSNVTASSKPMASSTAPPRKSKSPSAAAAAKRGRQNMASTIRVRATNNGDITEVQALIQHPMDSGFVKDAKGETIPAHFIQQLTFEYDGKPVFRRRLGRRCLQGPLRQVRFQGRQEGRRPQGELVRQQGRHRFHHGEDRMMKLRFAIICRFSRARAGAACAGAGCAADKIDPVADAKAFKKFFYESFPS